METFDITLTEGRVTGIHYRAARRMGATVLLGHGAGADQSSDFMKRFASGLAERGADAVTFNFLYMETKRGVPDSAAKLEACYRAAIDAVRKRIGRRRDRLFIGGKSMGGRIASQVAAAGVEGVHGLIFLGYPLHPPGKPEQRRDAHLFEIGLPMLFVQGERDPFGTPEELRPILRKLGSSSALYAIEGGDHSFKTPKRLGRTQEEVYDAALDAIAAWMKEIISAR